MDGLVFLVMFAWFMGLIGGGHVRTGGLIHLLPVAALVIYLIDGL